MADKLSIETVVRLLMEKRPENEECLWLWLMAYVMDYDGVEPDGDWDYYLPEVKAFLSNPDGDDATD